MRVLELSIVVPAYNEEKRLPGCLDALKEFSRSWPAGVEVLVVDDGSKDGTRQIAQAASLSFHEAGVRYRVLQHQNNQGKGAAVRTGILASTGSVVIFTDVDLAAPVSEFGKLVQAIGKGADVAVGSREGVRRTPIRKVTAVIFQRYVKTMLKLPCVDTQCGLKAFSGHAARALFGCLTCKGYAFDVEVLALAVKLGYHIEPVPVEWREIPGSKVNVFGQGIKMAKEVAQIRKRVCYASITMSEGIQLIGSVRVVK
ncbi:MAG: dolichyl-phosphate beta-glucosyltransferase [Bacillota bacterium]